jgi:hypothetical protein
VTTVEARRLGEIGRAIDAAEPTSTASRATVRRELNHIAGSARAAATAASRFSMVGSPLEGVATARSFNQRMMESRVARSRRG